MAQRSLSKQSRPQHQMVNYDEGSQGIVQQQNLIPTSVSARKYIRGTPADMSQPNQQSQIGSSSTQKLTAPIKSLQQKHKHLEMQLAQLSAVVASQASQQELEPRRKFNKQGSSHLSQNTYASPVEKQNQMTQNKVRISSKDRSVSGNKRIKPYSQAQKVTSPLRTDTMKQNLGQVLQGSGSKGERKRPITEIIDQFKRNSQGAVVVKLSNRGQKGGGSTNINKAAQNQIMNIKTTSAQQRQNTGSSATRQYYAGSAAQPITNASIDLSSQQQNASLNNGSSQRGLYPIPNTHTSGVMTAHAFHPTNETDLNQQQLINLQGNTATVLGPDDSSSGYEAFQEAQLLHGASKIGSSQPVRSISGMPRSHFDAAQPFDDYKQSQHHNNFISPVRQLQAATNIYQRKAQSFRNVGEWQRATNQRNQQACPDIVRGLENGILSLHNHLKTLEGKYIDLANYYKQELITQTNQSQEELTTNQQQKARPSSSSINQRRLQNSGQKSASRESSQNNFMRKTLDQQLQHQSQFSLSGTHKRTTPRAEATSQSRIGANGIRNYDEYKESSKLAQQRASYALDQAQERGIIEEVKTQKQKLENEMRKLIGLYNQICDDDSIISGTGVSGLGQKSFKSRFTVQQGVNDPDSFRNSQAGAILNSILMKYQNKLLTESEYHQQYGKILERTFEELYDELSDYCSSGLFSEVRQQNRMASTQQRLPSLSIMERIEKLSGDYDIQQEYSLSNLKETMFQIQHANDQFQLDIKKISLDFIQIEKKMLDCDRGLLQVLSMQSSSALDIQNQGSMDELTNSIVQVSNGLKNFAKRVQMNEQKLRVLQDSHSESVRYLREYRENFRHISTDYQIQSNAIGQNQNELSVDHSSANQSYNITATDNHRQQAEITQLNQEIFQLRTQLADAKQNSLLDLNKLSERLEELKNENASLQNTISQMNQEIQTKESQLTQRDQQNADLTKKLQSKEKSVEIQTARIFEDYWRQNCQSMVDLSQKFLHSMRRLQKVVHRKESNVQQEKQDFEAAKKELEVNLKEVKRNLESHPQLPQASADQAKEGPATLIERLQNNAASHSTSARPIVQSDPTGVDKKNMIQASHAQSMRAHMPGPSNRPINLLTGEAVSAASEQRSVQKTSSEQSQIPHKMADSDMQARFQQLQKELQEQNNENLSMAKKLQKERQKVQNLLTELKLSQENLQKIKLTFVPQENVNELESSIKQLQDTIVQYEAQDEEHRNTIQELKMSVFELNRIADDCKNKQFQDFGMFTSSVTSQVNDLVSVQASWLQSIESHLKNKEQQMAQMTETVDQVSQVVQEKNQRIHVLTRQNAAMSQIIESNQQLISQEREQANELEAELQSQVHQLRGELKVKQNGNRMLGALMRAFKQKLDEEMVKNRQVIERQTKDLNHFDQHVRHLSAKVEKKRFKSAQQKQVVAQTQQQLSQLQAKAGSREQDLVKNRQVLQQHQNQLEKNRVEIDEKETQVQSLMAKVEKKRFKSTQQKQALAQSQEQVGHLQAMVGSNEQDLVKSHNLLKKQAADLELRHKAVAEKESAVQNLEAKVEKKRFKSSQQKQIIMQTQQDINQLHAKVDHSQKQLNAQHDTVVELKNQNQQLQGTLKVKRTGNVMLNALMRAFKQKLVEEVQKNRAEANEKAEQIRLYAQALDQQDQEIQQLQTKLHQNEMQKSDTMKYAESKEQTMLELQSKLTSTQQRVAKQEYENDRLQSQVQKANGELKIKQNGNKMLGALMRAFKQKLEEEMVKNKQVIEQQTIELNQYMHVVNDRDFQVSELQAKVEKRRFKSSQQKQVLAETQDQVAQLQAKVGQKDQDLAKSRQLVETKEADLELREQEMQAQLQTMTTKIEKKRFKSAEQKQVQAQSQEQVQALQAKVDSNAQDLTKTTQQIKQQSIELDQRSKVIEEKEAQMQQLQAKVDKKRFKSTQQKQALTETQDQVAQLQIKIGSKEQDLAKSQQILEAKEAELEQRAKEMQRKETQLQTMATKIEKKRFKSGEQKQVQAQSQEHVEVLQAKVDKKRFKSAQQKQELAETQDQVAQLQAKIGSKDQDLAKSQQILEAKEAELEQRAKEMQEKEAQLQTMATKIEKKRLKSGEQKQVQAQSQEHVEVLQAKVDKKRFKSAQQKQALTETQDQVAQLQAKVGSKDQDLAKSQQILEAKEADLERIAKEMQEREAQLQSMQAKIEKKRFKSGEQKYIQAQSQEQVEVLQSKVDKKRFKSTQQKQALAETQDQVAQLQAKVGSKEQDLAKSQQILETKEAELAQRAKEIEEKEAQLQSLTTKIDKKRFKSAGQKQVQAQTQDQLQTLQAKVVSNEQDLVKRTKVIEEKETQMQVLHAKVEKKRFKSTQQKQIIAQTQNDITQLQANVGSSKKQIESQGAALSQLQDEKKQLEGTLKVKRTGNVMLNALMKAFKQKLVEEIENNRKAMDKKTEESQKYSQTVSQQSHQIKQLKHEIDAVKSDAQLESTELMNEIESLEMQLQDEKDKLTMLKEEHLKQDELLDGTKQALELKVEQAAQLEERNSALDVQHEKSKRESEAAMEGLRQERDQAQSQLSDFINQHKFEKESLEGKLQHQLNQTMAQLNSREDECEELQKQVTLLKEANATVSLDLNQQTQKLEKKKQKLVEFKTAKETQDSESRDDKAALEESRDLVVKFKAKIQQNEQMIAGKTDEVQNLRDKLELTIREASQKEAAFIDLEEELNQLREELLVKQDELQQDKEHGEAATEQIEILQDQNAYLTDQIAQLKSDSQDKATKLEAALKQIDDLKAENIQFKDQISNLKQQFQEKSTQHEAALEDEQRKVKEREELISECEALLSDFNNEKHEVKAKFKHLMELLKIKAAGSVDEKTKLEGDKTPTTTSQPSSYKGRSDEVDLNQCFEKFEQVIIEFKEQQESRIIELQSDKDQMVGTVQQQNKDLEAMQVSLAALQAKLDQANTQVESNDNEARRQIDTAMRKITNYKTKVTDKKQSIASMEEQIALLTNQLSEAIAKQNQSDSGQQDSFMTLQKENMQLLERLQKTERQLQNVRKTDEEDDDKSKDQPNQEVKLSPDVVTKLNGIDERMMELKRQLHQAKSTCLQDLTAKFSEQLKTARKTFIDQELLAHAIKDDKLTGWNNSVKECKNLQFQGKQFCLVQGNSSSEEDSKFYLVDMDRVTQIAANYLKSFIEDFDDDEFVQDVIIGHSLQNLDEESAEIEKLKSLVTDLRQDRIELQAELEQFKEGIKSDTSRLALLKHDEEMKDDIEYLTGENKELQVKVKQVCLTKASLQLQLAEARKQLRMQAEREEMSAIVDEAGIEGSGLNKFDKSDIETARNIGLEDEMFKPVKEMEMAEESSRLPDQIDIKEHFSENDSVNDIMNQIDEDNMINVSIGNLDIQQLKSKLQQAEVESAELKDRLDQAMRQINQMNEDKEKEDEDSGQSLIPHIKVTLIQFLRNVATTDRQNEDLLTIIFNMMEFTDVEIQELKIARLNIKTVKGKPARAASSSLAGGNSTNSMSKEDEGAAKPRRGLFGGMFGGRKKDPNTSGGGQSGSSSIPPSLRPVPRR